MGDGIQHEFKLRLRLILYIMRMEGDDDGGLAGECIVIK